MHLHAAGLFHIDTIDIRLDKALTLAGTLVIDATGIVGQFLQMQAHIVEIDMVHLIPGITAHKTAILADGHNVVESDTAHLPATAFNLALGETPVGILMIAIGPWIAGHIDRFCLAPPHIREEVAVECDIREHHIRNCSLITVLNTNTAVAGRNHTVVDHHPGNGVHILRAYLDGTRTGGHHTVGHHNIRTGTILLPLPTVFQADAVITRSDVAVADAHIPGMVHINAVTITDLHIVQE